MNFDAKTMERFEENVTIVPITGCWMWLGCMLNHGRGQFRVATMVVMLTHRFAYEAYVGPIPQGLELDHLCMNGWCCNPSHLEPVTGEENRRRYWASKTGRGRHRTHCKRGHPWADYTHINENGHRVCLKCRRTLDLDRKRKKSS